MVKPTTAAVALPVEREVIPVDVGRFSIERTIQLTVPLFQFLVQMLHKLQFSVPKSYMP